MREIRNEKRVAKEARLFYFFMIAIYQKRYLRKSKKADAKRQNDVMQRYVGAENSVKIRYQKIGVFVVGQQG